MRPKQMALENVKNAASDQKQGNLGLTADNVLLSTLTTSFANERRPEHITEDDTTGLERRVRHITNIAHRWCPGVAQTAKRTYALITSRRATASYHDQ